MNRIISTVFTITIATLVVPSAHGDTLCSGESSATAIDLTDGTRTAALTERIRYSTGWVDGATAASIAMVAVDGDELSTKTGTGFADWTPTKNGTYVLTHKVMSGDSQLGETLSATFIVTGIPKTETETTPVPVPYTWLEPYVAEFGSGDYEVAGNALSGKTQGGKTTTLWEEFVAGTNPTNETSVFTAKIDLQDGVPIVTWEPNLNTNSIERLYKVYGKETLSSAEEWAYPTNSLHRFFKVTVEMP